MEVRAIMKTREKKIINHKILDKHWLIGTIGLMLWGAIISNVVASIASIVLKRIIPLPTEDINYIGLIVGAFITLCIYKRWFYPEYEGTLKTINLGRWIIIGFIIVLIWLLPDVITSLILKTNFAPPTLHSVLMACVAGTVEETIFRGLPASYLMRQIKKKSLIPWVVIATGLVFGLVHAANILAGARIDSSILQVVSATCSGIMFAALFLRSGSLLPSIIAHTINDIYAFMNVDLVSEGILDGALKTSDIVLNLVLSVVELVIAYFILRPAVWDEVMETWNRKWNQPNEST